jgi:starch synthase
MPKPEPLKVLFVASEVTPYAKSGGLGDVAGSLPKALKRLGVDIRLVFPKYASIKPELIKDLEYNTSFKVMLGWRKQKASVYTLPPEQNSGVPYYLIDNDYYFGRDGFYGHGDDFERFAFFSKASIEFLPTIGFKPDIIHFNDWQTGPACVYLKDTYKKIAYFADMKSLFTIHNLQYQGIFGRGVMGAIDLNDGYFVPDKLEFYNNLSFMKAGLTYSDAISTVSDTYSREIQTPEGAYGLNGILKSRSHQLYGIINGIDYDTNDPEIDPQITANYSAEDYANKTLNKLALQHALGLPENADIPMFGLISRLVTQKGLDILAGILDELLKKDIQLVVLGTGDGDYEHMFRYMSDIYPQKLSTNILFSDKLARQIYAASDFFLMPSMFEPCGLSQLLAMRYGSIPIVRHTGGLADTVTHYDPETLTGNGFVFEHYFASGLMWAIETAIAAYHDKPVFDRIIKNAMTQDFSWDNSANKYIELYNTIKGDL